MIAHTSTLPQAHVSKIMNIPLLRQHVSDGTFHICIKTVQFKLFQGIHPQIIIHAPMKDHITDQNDHLATF